MKFSARAAAYGPLGLLLVASACSSGNATNSACVDGACVDAATADAPSPSPDTIAADTTSAADTTPADPLDASDAAQQAEAAPSCIPIPGEDLPDDDFIDANCDGIDGDKTKAIFVAPSGLDSAAGTIDAPLKTLTAGVDRAAKEGKSVYVCNGTYLENLLVKQAVYAGIYGGYDCSSAWKRGPNRAAIAPTTGIPIRISGVNSAMVIDWVRATAADASGVGESSIGVFVVDSPKVSIRNAEVSAGNGAPGRTPDAPPALSQAAFGPDGEPMATVECPGSNSPACTQSGRGGVPISFGVPACEHAGGRGGKGGISRRTPVEQGRAGTPTALGGVPTIGDGGPGKKGAGGVAGTSSKSGFGTLTAAGYSGTNAGADGEPGGDGGSGAGGTGGNGGCTDGDLCLDSFNGGGGGAGGSGGCGGSNGLGGAGGGASIALILWSSPVLLEKTILTSHTGGAGSESGPGGGGAPGGDPGQGGGGTKVGLGVGYAGGKGAAGGEGGPGGAGGGGPSYCIVVRGAAPTTSSVTFNRGAGGRGGVGAASAGDGAAGESAGDIKSIDAPAGDAGVDSGARDGAGPG